MDAILWITVIGGLAVAVFVVGFCFYSLRVGEKSIFHGSGTPASMAQMLLSSVHITSQFLFGVFVIVILIALMKIGTITTDAGLPLLSSVAGYVLGKTFKDVTFVPEETRKSK